MPPPRLFPFKDSKLDRMHRRVISTIQSQHFLFELPRLSPASWDLIVSNAKDRERLEFLGDALIGATVSEQLYRYWPNEGPGFYSTARSVLTANSTFAHLMCKVGHHDLNHPVKPAGDAFETVLAAFHSEQGSEAFNLYINQYFLPLINSAAIAYRNNGMNITDAKEAHTRRQMQDRCHKLTSNMLGNIKARNPLKNLKKYTRAGPPKKQNLARTFLLSKHGHQGQTTALTMAAGSASSSSTAANLYAYPRVSEVIDLTSDSDEQSLIDYDGSIIETVPSSFNQTRPPTTASSSKLAIFKADVHNRLRVCPPIGLGKIDEIKNRHILRSISVSPVTGKGKARELDILQSEVGKPSENDDDWIAQFSQTSLTGQLGSINNPITID